ncbi:MAG: M3 family metallopeptidase [Hyphomicrobiaceae bacterium]
MTVAATDNPLVQNWNTPFAMPPFENIAASHFEPAIEVALALHKDEIEQIAESSAEPTFDNTILALEAAGQLLEKVSGVFWNLTSAHTSSEMQALERKFSPRMAAHYNSITSNRALFSRIAAVHESRESLGLTAEQRQLLKRKYQSFVRAGASLDSADKTRLNDITERLAELGTKFSQNVLADENAFVLPLKTDADLLGLPAFVRKSAAAAATERGTGTPYAVTLSRSLIEPFLSFASQRHLRETAFKAWVSRGENGGETDNRSIIAEILQLRQERARLLSFETFAEYKLENTMAKTPAAVNDLLQKVWTPALAAAQRECARLTEAARADGQNTPIEPWDWRYYAERVRQADYALDEAEVKTYLPLEQMIAAAFHTAEQLFGLSFIENYDLPRFHPDVRTWEVKDMSGRHIGIFMGDYFARSSKRSGAWKSAFRRQRKFNSEESPIILNVMNFAKAQEGEPCLLSFTDAQTLFHEFGHALHGLLSDVTYGSLAGTNVERDFVELPSQLFEHWLLTDEILTKFARHYQTGDQIQAELIKKIKAAQTFNQGFATLEYLASALVDMAFHGPNFQPGTDPSIFERHQLDLLGMPSAIAMRHRAPHFQHIFSGDGYSAGYYSYMWSEVLDADAFTAFEETGDVFDPETAERLRTFVYAAGGTRDGEDAYLAFRGKLPSANGLLKQRGLAS